ncbi:MAG: FixH family protein, partial [Candidatus Rokuibacteriota bacterium]
PQAELACSAASTAAHVYDCTVRLWRGGRPLDGVGVVAGADMPSMPLAHAVRPVTAAPGKAPGEYTFRLALEMRGQWAVKLRLSGPVREQLILHYDFDGTGAAPARR